MSCSLGEGVLTMADEMVDVTWSVNESAAVVEGEVDREDEVICEKEGLTQSR
jgi:hypothetical protein